MEQVDGYTCISSGVAKLGPALTHVSGRERQEIAQAVLQLLLRRETDCPTLRPTAFRLRESVYSGKTRKGPVTHFGST